MKKRNSLRGAVRRRPIPPDKETPKALPGILRADTGSLKLPREDEQNSGAPGLIVLIITILALAFIAIITWLVIQMPAKPT